MERSRKLELKIYELLLHFPERLDQMETRNEDACRRLARAIRELVERETEAPGGEPPRGESGRPPPIR